VAAAAELSAIGSTAGDRPSDGGTEAGRRGGGPARGGGREEAGDAVRLALELLEDVEEEGVGGVASEDLEAEADLGGRLLDISVFFCGNPAFEFIYGL
jgi:hypothetical protein